MAGLGMEWGAGQDMNAATGGKAQSSGTTGDIFDSKGVTVYGISGAKLPGQAEDAGWLLPALFVAGLVAVVALIR